MKAWSSFLPATIQDRPNRKLISAKDFKVTFGDGRQCWDLTSGLWNVNFGYGNPFVKKRIDEAIEEGHYLSLFRYSNPYADEVAEKLLNRFSVANGSVIFSTSGSSLNDLAVKVALFYSTAVGRLRARKIVTLCDSYHGTTLNSLAMSGDELNQRSLGIQNLNYFKLSLNEEAKLLNFLDKFGESIALVSVEPIQGSTGERVPSDLLSSIFQISAKRGFLVAADEVASGFFRLGEYAASRTWPEAPNLIGVSKGFTNGTVASSALMLDSSVTQALRESEMILPHGETQAGSPVAMAATLGVFDFIDSCDIKKIYSVLASEVKNDLTGLAKSTGAELKGDGLFWHLDFASPLCLDSDLSAVDYFQSKGLLVQGGLSKLVVAPQVAMPIPYWKTAFATLGEALERVVQQ